jgi:hypothetical protein
VDEVEYELAPKEKRPRLPGNPHLAGSCSMSGGEDTGAEADNEKSEYETEGDQGSLTGMNSQEEMEPIQEGRVLESTPPIMTAGGPTVLPPAAGVSSGPSSTPKRAKKMLVARPFGLMRGHTAFLTFATAGNRKQPNPNATKDS